jgi:hypothetical protein
MKNDLVETIAQEKKDIDEVKQKVLAFKPEVGFFDNLWEKSKEMLVKICISIFSPYILIIGIAVVIVVGCIGFKCARAGMVGPSAQVASHTVCCCC